MALLKALFVIILIYYLFRLVARQFIRRTMEKMQQQSKQHYTTQGDASRREGEIYVDYTPKQDKQIDKATGEYVDYEEIKD